MDDYILGLLIMRTAEAEAAGVLNTHPHEPEQIETSPAFSEILTWCWRNRQIRPGTPSRF